MAIKTGAIYKTLTFDGLNSGDYGVYITGSAVYNSPEKDVEMVSIPGRNGAFALDHGRFQNIEVSYPAGLYGVDPEDFAVAISDFRNAIGSRAGYCRLEDDYNPEEFRLAVFKAGLEVNPASLESGEFTITFDCKPQRFLTSGESAQAITSGGTITNPTPFNARPLLQVWGYGNIDIEGQDLVVFDTTIGNINLYPSTTRAYPYFYGTIDDTGLFNAGDTITVKQPIFKTVFNVGSMTVNAVGAETVTGDALAEWNAAITGSNTVAFTYGWGDINFTAGTYKRVSTSVATSVTVNGGTYSVLLQLHAVYDPDDHSIEMEAEVKLTSDILLIASYDEALQFSSIYGYSTKTALGSPLYFDLDIGEAYNLEGGTPVSVNNAVTIPAALPTLKPGSNTITFDNTVTQLKVVPRWWKL